MKSFKKILSEIAAPISADEKEFKGKHKVAVLSHPVATDAQHTGDVGDGIVDPINARQKRLADYTKGKDLKVYEQISLDDKDVEKRLERERQQHIRKKIIDEAKMDQVGQEDDDIDNDGDVDKSDKYLHNRRKAIGKAMKESLYGLAEKKLDPVGQEDGDIDNDGDKDDSDEYLHTRRKAIAKAMKEEIDSKYISKALDTINARITKPGQSPRHPSYEKAPSDVKTAVMNLAKMYAKQKNEEVELIEKAVSQAQQQAAGVALAVKRGDKPKSELVGASKEMYKMSEKDLEDFAKTKHKGLPQRVDEANASKIIASVNAGDSIDVTVQKNLNKRGDNKDEILKVIRDYNWKKRMKKEEVEELDEANKNIIPDRELNKLVDTKKAVFWRSSGFDKLPNEKFFYIPILDKNKKMLGVYKANANDSDQEFEYLDSMLKDLSEATDKDTAKKGKDFWKFQNMSNKDIAASKKATEKKESVDHIAEATPSPKQITRALQGMKVQPKEKVSVKKAPWDEKKNEEVSLYEALPAHIVRGDSYVGIPDGIVAQAKERVRRLKPATSSEHYQEMHKALSDLGWEMTVGGKYVRESFELSEAFKVGAVKLNDGSSVIIKEADAKLLNQLVNELTDKNREAMMKTAMKDKKSFNEILSFAKEAL